MYHIILLKLHVFVLIFSTIIQWLEAGIFFLFANYYYNGSQGQLWENLACDRLNNYIHAKRKWERNADFIESLKQ